MTDYTPHSIPQEPGRWRGIALAVVVHLALLAFLWIGINWQSRTPAAVEAEIWDPQVRDAAPLPPPPPEPVTTPAPPPPPPPVVQEQPKAAPPEQLTPKVDIALEKQKKRKEQEHLDKLAQQEQEKKLKEKAEQERLDKEKLAQQQAEQKKADQLKKTEQERQAKDKLAQQQAEQKKNEQLKKTELAKKHKQDALDAQAREKIRADEMRRLTGAVGSGGNGAAEKSQGNGRAKANYVQKVAAIIRSNTIFPVPDDLNGNPSVEYDVQLLPDGSLRGEPRLIKPSGVAGFDEAVKRGIERSQRFPADSSGSVPSGFTVSYKPKDLRPQ